jgi:hypothetical protein
MRFSSRPGSVDTDPAVNFTVPVLAQDQMGAGSASAKAAGLRSGEGAAVSTEATGTGRRSGLVSGGPVRGLP